MSGQFTRAPVAVACILAAGLGAGFFIGLDGGGARAQAPDYAKMLAAPDRSAADRAGPTKGATRCRFCNSAARAPA